MNEWMDAVMQTAAASFCQEHALDKSIAGPLAGHIQGNLDRALQDALAQVRHFSPHKAETCTSYGACRALLTMAYTLIAKLMQAKHTQFSGLGP